MSTPAPGKKKIFVYLGLMLLVAGAAGSLYVLSYQKKCGEKKTALQNLKRQLGMVGAKLDNGEVENLEKELPSIEAIEAIDVCSADRVFQKQLIDQSKYIGAKILLTVLLRSFHADDLEHAKQALSSANLPHDKEMGDRWKEVIDLMERGDFALANEKYNSLCESQIKQILSKGLIPDAPGLKITSFDENACSLFSKGKIAPWLGLKYKDLLVQDLNKKFQAEQEQDRQRVSDIKKLASGKGELHDETWKPSRKKKILLWNLVTDNYYCNKEPAFFSLKDGIKPNDVYQPANISLFIDGTSAPTDYKINEALFSALEGRCASPSDSEMTIFCIRKQDITLTIAKTDTSGDKATKKPFFLITQEKVEIAVISWPEKTLAGLIQFDNGAPPNEYTEIGALPVTRDMIIKWILSLPEEK